MMKIELGSDESSATGISKDVDTLVSTSHCTGDGSGGGAIYFYLVNKPFGYFSNFSAHPIFLKNLTWPTVEHYFQAQKFAGTPHEEAVRTSKDPKTAAQMGRDRKRPLRNDWQKIKDQVMREALYTKFKQHTDLKIKLQETGCSELIEHTARDSYWADGGDGSGENKLGVLLMELRAALRDSAQ